MYLQVSVFSIQFSVVSLPFLMKLNAKQSICSGLWRAFQQNYSIFMFRCDIHTHMYTYRERERHTRKTNIVQNGSLCRWSVKHAKPPPCKETIKTQICHFVVALHCVALLNASRTLLKCILCALCSICSMGQWTVSEQWHIYCIHSIHYLLVEQQQPQS